MKKSNNIIMGILVAVVAVMGVAFAAFSTTLNINGTATISSTWDVKFVAGTCTQTIQKDPSLKSTGTVTIPTGTTTATIVANMASPGDEISCTITVQNQGTLAAKRTGISFNGDGHTIANGDSNFTWTVTPTAQEGTVLAAKNGSTVASETITIKIMYSNEVTSKPTSSSTFKLIATYAQAL